MSKHTLISNRRYRTDAYGGVYTHTPARLTWFVSGRFEVMKDWREGEQTESWQYACWKRRLVAASASRWGVWTGRP